MSDELRQAAAWILLAAPLLPLAVVVVAAEHAWSDNIALRERIGIAIRDLLVSFIIALLSANYLFGLNLDPVLLGLAFISGLIAISAPSAVWLVIYFRDGFR